MSFCAASRISLRLTVWFLTTRVMKPPSIRPMVGLLLLEVWLRLKQSTMGKRRVWASDYLRVSSVPHHKNEGVQGTTEKRELDRVGNFGYSGENLERAR